MVAPYDLCIDLPRKSQKFQKVGQFGMTTGNNFRNIGTVLWFAILDLNLLSTCIVCSSMKHILDKFFSIKICSFCLKGKIETTIIGTQRFFQKCHPLFVGINNFKVKDSYAWMNIIGKMKRSGLSRDGQEGSTMFYHVVVKARTKWISAGSWCAESEIFSKTCARLSLGRNGKTFGFCRVRMLHFQNAKQFPGSAVWDVTVSWRKLGISGTQVTSVTLDFGTFESKVSDPNFPIRFRYVWCSAWKLGGYQQWYPEQLFGGNRMATVSSVQTLQIVSLKWSIYANMTAIQYARMPRKKLVASLRLVDLHGPRR